MKLISYKRAGTPSFGVLAGDGVVDLASRTGHSSLKQMIAAGDLAQAAALAAATPDMPLSEAELLPVIPDPDKIICVGLNYRDHVDETGRAHTGHPMLFPRFAASQVAHGAPMILPRVSAKFDFEGELAAIVGKPGRHIAEADALAHVAGYACYNDGSIRDWQNHTTQFMPGKNFAGTGAFGPWMLTSDELPDPTRITLVTRLNGTEMQRTTGALMIHSVPQIIAYVSSFIPLAPGDVLVTGTPGGVGARRTPPVFMKPGDVVEVEITPVGVLRNTIAAEGPG